MWQGVTMPHELLEGRAAWLQHTQADSARVVRQ